MQLTFATFDVDITPEIEAQVKAMEPNFNHGPAQEMIKLLFASARRTHPGCRRVILTDEHTQFPDMPDDVEIFRYQLDISKLTMSRTIAQLEFLRQSKGETHIVFVDTDILIQGNLDKLFTKNFDVGLTYRQNFMPINGGVIFINGRGYWRASIFMERILGLMRDRYIEWQSWYGSQLALKEAINLTSTLTNEVIIVDHDWGMRVLLVPGSIYNFTTPETEVMDKHYPDKVILHFKGPRKELMFPYYEKYFKL